MSEKINELIKSVKDLKYDASTGTFETDRRALFEFAELIVQECMEQVWYTREDGINGNVSQVIKDRIKEHFGVEE